MQTKFSRSASRPQSWRRAFAWRAPVVPTVVMSFTVTFFLTTLLSSSSVTTLQQPSTTTQTLPPSTVQETETTITKDSPEDVTTVSSSTPSLSATESAAASREAIDKASRSFHSWVTHLRATSVDGGVHTTRTLCRELSSMAQTCVYEGLMCIGRNMKFPNEARPVVYFVDEAKSIKDYKPISSDDWCYLRHTTSNPRYYGSRHWPILNETLAPQHSCLDGQHIRYETLFGGKPDNDDVNNNNNVKKKISWTKSLAIIDVDQRGNDHNAHFAMDVLWLLDASLHDESLRLSPPPYKPNLSNDDRHANLLTSEDAYYVTQTYQAFDSQTLRDVNRLLYAIILRKDPLRLFPNNTAIDLHTSAGPRRQGQRFLDAYPELLTDKRLYFHDEKRGEEELLCTSRLTSGFKTGFNMPENVCRHIRTQSYKLYGVERPETKRAGHVQFAQPTRNVLIIDRHYTRKIANAQQVFNELRDLLKDHDVQVNFTTTDAVFSAEEHVRIFSSAGVIISPHGGQNMAEMFMQRHSALIELMPVGYADYTYSLLAEPCQIWYYEFQASVAKNETEEMEKNCNDKTPHLFNPCNLVKPNDLYVNVTELYLVVLNALEHIGHDTGTWVKHHTYE